MSQRGDLPAQGDTVKLDRAQKRYEEAQAKVSAAKTPSERRRFEREANACRRQLERAEQSEGYATGRRRAW